MATRPNEQIILTDFHGGFPDLSALLGEFSAYAADAIAVMRPHARFGEHDTRKVFDHEHYVDTFGIDTSHHTHPVKQFWVVKNLLERDFSDISGKSREDLFLSAIVHDMGEPFSEHGDKLADTKTDDEEIEEVNQRHKAIRAITPGWAEEIIDRTEPILGKDANTDPNKPIFALSERIGYLLTGGLAAGLYMHPADGTTYDLAPAHRIVAGVIAADVLHRNLAKVTALREASTYLDAVMQSTIGPMKVADMQLLQQDPTAHAAMWARFPGNR